MRRKSVIRSIAGLNLGLAVLLLALLSTMPIPLSMGQAVETPDVIFSGASSNDPVNTDDPGYDRDVACTEVAIASGNKTLEVTISNAYPGYRSTVGYTMRNNGTLPAKIVGFNMTADDPLAVAVTGLALNDEISPNGGTKHGSLEVEILDSAEEGKSYAFSVSINFEGSEEPPPSPPPGPRWPEVRGESPRGTTMVAGPVCAFRIIQLTLSPDEVYADEPVTVGVLITNPCDEPQSCEVILKVNGVVQGKKEVVIKPHETKRVTFTILSHVVGTYSIEVNGFGAGTLVVKELEFPGPSMPSPFDWWLILIIAIAAGGTGSVITYVIVRKKKQAGVLPGD